MQKYRSRRTRKKKQQPLKIKTKELEAPRERILKSAVVDTVKFAKMTVNGNGNGHLTDMERVFPESHIPLAEADPEMHAIIQDEKKRQW